MRLVANCRTRSGIRKLRYFVCVTHGVNIRDVLESFRNGTMTAAEAEKALRLDYLETIGSHTMFDGARALRKGVPEIIYASSKTPEMTAEIASGVTGSVLISRASDDHYKAVAERIGNAVYRKDASMILIGDVPPKTGGTVGIMTAGSSDASVAEEAAIVAEYMGCRILRAFDLGVAGLHRILEPMREMIENDADCIVVAAGMEGALPALVASLSPVPVIGVPTSTGYGLGGSGEAALMSMLQTCSPGLTVVNIGNGVGAGAAAAMIARRKNVNVL